MAYESPAAPPDAVAPAAKSDPAHDLPVPDDVRRTSRGLPAVGCALAAFAFCVPVALYFGIFGLIFLDEVVFRTHWAAGNLPDEFGEAFRVIYAPLIFLVTGEFPR